MDFKIRFFRAKPFDLSVLLRLYVRAANLEENRKIVFENRFYRNIITRKKLITRKLSEAPKY